MMDREASADSDIGRLIAELDKLYALTDDLSRKMHDVDAATLIQPEFIRRSLASIYDSQAVLSHSVVRVLEILHAHGFDVEPPDDRAAAAARPHLRLVDPEG